MLSRLFDLLLLTSRITVLRLECRQVQKLGGGGIGNFIMDGLPAPKIE